MTQRETVPVAETESYLNVSPMSSAIVVEGAAEWAVENADAERDPDLL